MSAYDWRAANYTHVPSGQTDSAIADGGSLVVYLVVATNTSGATATVLVEENDGSTLIQPIQVANGTTEKINYPFLAKNGLKITTPANTTCTVYHSNKGA